MILGWIHSSAFDTDCNLHTHTYYEDLYYQLTVADGMLLGHTVKMRGGRGWGTSIDLKQAPVSRKKYSQEQNLHVRWEGSVTLEVQVNGDNERFGSTQFLLRG